MKDWIGTNNSIFKQIGASNHCDDERQEDDYYATVPKAIDDLFAREEFDKYIWECAGGGSHLANRMKQFGKIVWNTDIVNRGGQDDLIDFLEYNEKFKGDIITNPPYKFCSQFILKALDLIEDGHKVAMFLKLTTLEGQKRYNQIYSKYPPKTIYVYVKRIACFKNGNDNIPESAVAYAWFVWIKGSKTDPIIKWIN